MTKYVNNNGVSEMWLNIKNWVTSQLLGYSQTGHTHTKSEITDFPTIPTKTSDLTNDSGFLTSHQDLSGYVPKAGGAVLTGSVLGRTVNNDELQINGGTSWGQGASIALGGKDKTGNAGIIYLHANDSTSYNQLEVLPNGEFKQNLNGTIKNVAMQEDTVPRSGGAVMTGKLAKVNDTSVLTIIGAPAENMGALINLYGKNQGTNLQGAYLLQAYNDIDGHYRYFVGYPDGTLTWFGQPIQYTSDQRLKQQISEIDDKLLDAWEDVNPVQFKYNDAVDQKKDKARLHTGYVVQQIDDACNKHNVDVSKYGLYCHEEYAEETREVEQADGTKTIEVVRPANEHYSLRYTEALIVECAYLRKKNKELQEQLDKLASRLDKLEGVQTK